jgi:hypothetical protein
MIFEDNVIYFLDDLKEKKVQLILVLIDHVQKKAQQFDLKKKKVVLLMMNSPNINSLPDKNLQSE